MALQHLINHVSLVVDKSDSMAGHTNKVVEVFDRELNNLKQRSVDENQETRISIYLFSDKIEVLTFDMDVMRFTSLKDYYRTSGMTALLDATAKAIDDNSRLPELYGDHAFLTYVITDGGENASKTINQSRMQQILGSLKDNWTTAVLVPDKNGETYAQRVGFTAGSIAIWDTKASFDKVGTQFSSVMNNYLAMRKTGVRGTKNLFELNPANLTKTTVKSALKELPTTEYDVYPVRQVGPIKEFVETWTKNKYRLGSAYYQPTKPVKVQDYKNILIQEAATGKVYEGSNVRQLLGLPDYSVEVNPVNHPQWRMFIQSASVNRKLFPNTFVLVRR